MSTTEEPPPEPPVRSDRFHWYWLLLIPIIVPLLPMLYNGTDPTLWGIPRFYWLQLSFVFLSVAITLVVYRQTRGR